MSIYTGMLKMKLLLYLPTAEITKYFHHVSAFLTWPDPFCQNLMYPLRVSLIGKTQKDFFPD